MSTTTYAAQVRSKADSDWTDIGSRIDVRDAANLLRLPMERAGLRYSELHAHVDDLIAGHVLTADSGRAFRVVPVELAPVRLSVLAQNVRVGDVVIAETVGGTRRHIVTTVARRLGGSGLVQYGLLLDGHSPSFGRQKADNSVTVERR